MAWELCKHCGKPDARCADTINGSWDHSKCGADTCGICGQPLSGEWTVSLKQANVLHSIERSMWGLRHSPTKWARDLNLTENDIDRMCRVIHLAYQRKNLCSSLIDAHFNRSTSFMAEYLKDKVYQEWENCPGINELASV